MALIHSHPAPPNPSIKDLNGMRLWPIPWVIVDSRACRVKAWLLTSTGVYEVKLEFI